MNIEQAINELRNGNIIILPSDTLYGVAANAYDKLAVEKVYALKNRSEEKKLPVHYASLVQIEKDIILTPTIIKLSEKFMPGALTIIANKRADSKLCCVEKTVAFRIPNHKTVLEIITKLDAPITMPSANKSGQIPELRFEDIDLGICGIADDDAIGEIQSTIIDATSEQIKLVRDGAVPFCNVLAVV